MPFYSKKGGGGGNASVGALLRQGNDAAVGLFISYPDATEMWHLRGVAREAAEASVAARAEYVGATNSHKLNMVFADDPASERKQFTPVSGGAPVDPEVLNTYILNHREYPNPQALATARADYGDLRISSAVSGVAGNSDRYVVAAGTPATPGDPAYADVAGAGGNFLRIYTTVRGMVGNTGEVRVVTGGARSVTTARAASASRFIGNLAFGVTFHETGTDGNGWVITLTGNSGGGTTVDADAKTVAVNINGNLTYLAMKTAIDAIRVGGVQFFTASYNSGLDSQNAGNGSWTLSGGRAASNTNPLTAAWDDTTKRLTITAIATDTLREVREAVDALAEFQNGSSGISPGDLDFGIGGGNGADSAITVDATVGNHIDYDFARGLDSAVRTPLAARSITDTDGGGHQFQLTGVIDTDTTQDVIDAYSGGDFVLSSVGGDASATLSGASVALASLTGGRDEVLRQLPDVEFNGRSAYTIFYHGPGTDASRRTTLAEMRTAWQNVTNGLSPQLLITGTAGSRIGTVPAALIGGADFEDADLLEAIVRANDENSDGTPNPNIELRYDEDEDTLEEIADALALQGVVGVVAVYGTDLSQAPEAPPFTRSMFQGGGDSTGITGITIEDEGTPLTGKADTINFTGAGVTASGSGATKTVNIPGGGAMGSGSTVPLWTTGQAWAVGAQSRTGRGSLYVCLTAIAAGDANSDDSPDTAAPSIWYPVQGFVGTWHNNIYVHKGNTLEHNDKFYFAKADVQPSTTSPDSDTTNFLELGAGGGDGEDNVQSNWDETDANSDAFILNKPTTLPGADATARAAAATALAAANAALPLAGGTMTGKITLDGAPTSDLHAASKKYVDDNSGGSGTPYTLPQATESALGGVQGATSAQATGASGTTILGWTVNRIRQLLGVALPTIDNADAIAGTSTARRVWTSERVRQAINAVVPAVFRDGDTSRIPIPKLASGTPDGTKFVRDDGTLATPAGSGGAGEQGPPGPPGSLGLTKVGNTIALDSVPPNAASQGPALTALTDQIKFRIRYERGGQQVLMWSDYRKVDISTSEQLQFQGGGGAYMTVEESGGNLQLTYGDVAGYSSIEVEVFNVGAANGIPAWDAETDYADTDQSVYDEKLYIANKAIPGDANNDNPATATDDWDGVGTGGGDGAALSDADPLIDGEASAGTSSEASRADHVHPAGPVLPHVSSFSLSRGAQDPAAGSIAALVYSTAWAIAQSDHVGAARIIGFKGAFDDSSVTTLHTLASGNYAHGSSDVTIPTGISLAADETYTLRLQVFGESVTSPQDATVPASYQDIVITAHAAALADYHVGYVAYNANDADGAATLARIVDFSNDSATFTSLPSRIEIDVPADGSAYQLYLAAESSETQPGGFTSDGLPVTASFYPGRDKAVSGTTYTFYVLRPGQRVTSADNGDYFGVT